ncbi:T9SS type A sorting domain-containing protein [Formosa maritima]|uniref:T9SS type A sorting domain-containing protein n=1 Tax=Formosa maritima TaxID=2592046 RepID=A0A5D0GJW8_9FLAO|nr:T9SS type A sorting domain-containing protein [Formosa maritima]TYA59315.1 T9SS type A sorting domain-containing protein [Formosa maritima]
MKKICFLMMLCIGFVASAQTIEKFSIDNGGASITAGEVNILYTIGEVNIQELSVGNIQVSEGFINPITDGPTLSIESETAEVIKIFPNPVSETLYISTDQQIETVTLYDLLGKQVLLAKKVNQIEVRNLKSGIYLLKIKTDRSKITKKIIIN